MMEARRQPGGSTLSITEENRHEEEEEEEEQQLKSPNSVSSTSSPSHEFSFALTVPFSTTQRAVDLSPADDIFFYGHLLPLHLFPRLPVSPRSSTDSSDGFTLPGTEFVQNQTSFAEPVRPPKSKSFAFFKRWRKRSEAAKPVEAEKKRTQRQFRFELSRLLKRYARLARPLLTFREGRRNKRNQFKPQPISYSGNLGFRGRQEVVRGRGGEYASAPASIRTSPVNSGILLTTAKRVPSPVADSTMEELQSAIQAAIAHCKNSIAADKHCKL